MAYLQTENGKTIKAREIHIGKKFTVVFYHKCKIREKRIDITRDRFFGTGVTVLLFLKF